MKQKAHLSRMILFTLKQHRQETHVNNGKKEQESKDIKGGEKIFLQ